MMPTTPSTNSTWTQRLWERVDAAPLALFRRVLGFILVIRCAHLLLLCIDFLATTSMTFHFPGFAWLPRPPFWVIQASLGLGMLGGAGMAIGVRPRQSAALAGAGLIAFTLVDLSIMGHLSYLLGWMALLAAALPSVSPQAPGRVGRWAIWAPRLLLGVMYFFAGVIKLHSDWLSGALILEFAQEADMHPGLTALFSTPWIVEAMAWAGAAFDLAIGPLLIWPRTRRVGLVLMSLFHLSNTLLVGILVLPMLMLLLTWAAFMPTATARQLITRDPQAEALAPQPGSPPPRAARVAMGLLVALHLLLPLRPYLEEGDGRWRGAARLGTWWLRSVHMDVEAKFFVSARGLARQRVDPHDYITPEQTLMATDPYLIVQFAHHVAAHYRAKGYEDVQVYAETSSSLNGRPRQAFLRPEVDLAAEPIRWDMSHLVVPLGDVASDAGARTR